MKTQTFNILYKIIKTSNTFDPIILQGFFKLR